MFDLFNEANNPLPLPVYTEKTSTLGWIMHGTDGDVLSGLVLGICAGTAIVSLLSIWICLLGMSRNRVSTCMGLMINPIMQIALIIFAWIGVIQSFSPHWNYYARYSFIIPFIITFAITYFLSNSKILYYKSILFDTDY